MSTIIDSLTKEQMENIKMTFENYKEDYNFGGDKHLMKCSIDIDEENVIEVKLCCINKKALLGISEEILCFEDINNEMNK